MDMKTRETLAAIVDLDGLVPTLRAIARHIQNAEPASVRAIKIEQAAHAIQLIESRVDEQSDYAQPENATLSSMLDSLLQLRIGYGKLRPDADIVEHQIHLNTAGDNVARFADGECLTGGNGIHEELHAWAGKLDHYWGWHPDGSLRLYPCI